MNERSPRGQRARLWVSWSVVSALLGYGVVQTVLTAAKLFTG
ncbi:MFS transporter small subunit [Micromonospora sp. NBC_00421]